MSTILLVEDDPMALETMSQALPADHTLILASTAEAALELIQEVQPELVISDVILPGLSGLDLLRSVRTEPSLASTKVMLVSGSAIRHEADYLANAYMSKPFDNAHLQWLVARLTA